ncbi:hypothetical protein AAHA92_14855 [Salvia divinorum]|uniref:Ubiquitin-like protease family profile domain-containing protein n=1 Tax=Salvia divinorum TaxID=28513 RepID=A0ABD1HD37_SALDI
MTKENIGTESNREKDGGDNDDRTLALIIEDMLTEKKRKADNDDVDNRKKKKGKEIVIHREGEGEGEGEGVVVLKQVKEKRRTLAGRRSPLYFVEMLQSLNDKQRAAVKEIGVDTLLHYNIKSIPRVLARYLLENFEPISCTIVLNSDDLLFLDEEDVHITLGFPMGPLPIERKKFQKNLNIKSEIAKSCSGGQNAMVPNYIVEQLHKDKEGGQWFKWNFMILVEVTLINTPPDGNVRPKILDYISDVENIKKYNWCRYVISELLKTHKSWIKKPDKVFGGPSVFVVACYVDRVVHGKKMINRCYPTVKGWTAELMKEREKLELKMEAFGLGHLYERYKKLPHEEVEEEVACGSQSESIPTHTGEAGSSIRNERRTFMRDWNLCFNEMLSSASKMVRLLQGAPDHVKSMDSFKIVCDTTRKAMGVAQEEDENVIHDAETMSHTMCNDDLDDPEWIDVIISLTKAAEEKYILKDRNEFPTFTLIPEWQNTCNENAGRVPEVQEAEAEAEAEKETDAEAENDKQKEKGLEAQEKGTEKEAGENEQQKEQEIGTEQGEEQETGAEKETSKEAEVDSVICSLIEDLIGGRGSDGNIIQEGQQKEEKDKGKNKVADEHDTGRTVRTTKKIVEALCSPYNVRNINIKGKITKEDKEVMNWLMTNDEIDSFMVVYEDDRLFVYKGDFHTLAPQLYASTNIIDAWASYLNYQEEYRSKASPRRLFISTTPTLFNVTARQKEWSEPVAREKFCTIMSEYISKIPNFKWGNYDIIFFPIFAHEHFYLICFNLKGESVDIIDNSEVVPELLKNKYGNDPERLKKFFTIYLGNGDNISMGKVIKNSAVKHIDMPWKNDTNKVDCGVYLMRHMETYMGGPIKNWVTGLTKKGTESLVRLRVRYAEVLLKGPTNKKASEMCAIMKEKFEKYGKDRGLSGSK